MIKGYNLKIEYGTLVVETYNEFINQNVENYCIRLSFLICIFYHFHLLLLFYTGDFGSFPHELVSEEKIQLNYPILLALIQR